MPKKEMDAVKEEHEADGLQIDETVTTGANSEKMPLQKWLSSFTSRGVNMRVAMALASKMFVSLVNSA